MRHLLWKLVKDEEGTAAVEYALLLAVVVVVTIGAWVALQAAVRDAMTTATNAISEPLG